AQINQFIENMQNNILDNPASLSPEELELWQTINADMQSLSQSSVEQVAELVTRIQDNINRLLDLSKTVEKPVTAEEFTELINDKLTKLGYSDESIAKLTDSQKISIVVSGKPYEVFDYKLSEQISKLSDQINQDQ